MPSKSAKAAAKANHPCTWRIDSIRENGPAVTGSKHRAGSVRVRASDGTRVLNVDLMPDEVESFDPAAHWALTVAPNLRFRR